MKFGDVFEYSVVHSFSHFCFQKAKEWVSVDSSSSVVKIGATRAVLRSYGKTPELIVSWNRMNLKSAGRKFTKEIPIPFTYFESKMIKGGTRLRAPFI